MTLSTQVGAMLLAQNIAAETGSSSLRMPLMPHELASPPATSLPHEACDANLRPKVPDSHVIGTISPNHGEEWDLTPKPKLIMTLLR